MKNNSIYILIFLFYSTTIIFCRHAFAQNAPLQTIKEGDIIFQKLPCGSLCDAIITTTPCKPGMAFNHCGIIHYHGTMLYVIEAIGKTVKQTPLAEFEKRDTEKVIYTGRVKPMKEAANQQLTAKTIEKALHYIGTPYDDAFLPGDKALYCSELIWECYYDNGGKRLFSLQPMTFKSPATGITFPAWTDYYTEIAQPIPEGIPGINPCAIANSDIIEFRSYKK